MTTKLYIGGVAATRADAGFDPTIAGTWDAGANSGQGNARPLDTNPEHLGLSENPFASASTTNNPWDLIILQGITGPLAAQSISGTLSALLQMSESSPTADMFLKVHAWITQGDSSTPRGTLLSNHVGAVELNTTGAAVLQMNAVALSSVSAQAGDRIVIEVGARETNVLATAFLANLRMGTLSSLGMNLSDAVVPDTASERGYFTFSQTLNFNYNVRLYNLDVNVLYLPSPVIARRRRPVLMG